MRQQVLEVILHLLADSGVDDVHLVIAVGPAPPHDRGGDEADGRATAIFDAFYPDRYYNHDAEDPDGMLVARHHRPRREGRSSTAVPASRTSSST